MFGTLLVTDDVRKPVPLQFVENRDLSSALSRNSRDRPHVSCELCRARKVRCSGQPSGCNRCEAVGVECRYPPREPRRKATQNGGRKTTGDSSTQGAGSGDDKTAAGKDGKPQQQSLRDPSPVQPQQDAPFPPYGESGGSGALLSTTSPQVLDHEMDSDYLYQHPGDVGYDKSVKDGLDEWLDINRILDTSLPPDASGAGELGYFDATMIDPTLMDDEREHLTMEMYRL